MTNCFYLILLSFMLCSLLMLLLVLSFSCWSFLKLEIWSCFANNRHAFVLFFVLNGIGGDGSAQRSTPGRYSRGQNVIFSQNENGCQDFLTVHAVINGKFLILWIF